MHQPVEGPAAPDAGGAVAFQRRPQPSGAIRLQDRRLRRSQVTAQSSEMKPNATTEIKVSITDQVLNV
jgi:hypothetical protein